MNVDEGEYGGRVYALYVFHEMKEDDLIVLYL